MQQFWMGFEDRLEKTAGVGTTLGSLAGKAVNAVRGAGGAAGSLVKNVASTPGRTGQAFKEGLRSGTTAASAVKPPLKGFRRDVNKMLTGAALGGTAAYVATNNNNQQRTPY